MIHQTVESSAYDIILEGSPLDWAVITRNSTLVHALLPYSKHYFGIQHALFHYYYEIASDLLSEDTARAVLPPGYRKLSFAISRPFRHWIAHGRDGTLAIQRAIQLCLSFGLIDHYQALRCMILRARAQVDLKVLEALLGVCPRSTVKHRFRNSRPALHFAMCVSGNNTGWNRVLGLIVSHYSVAELNDHTFRRDGAFDCLHIALASGSVPAVRIMLEKGVDANARTHSAVPLMPL
jgi:hypothetical protein